MPIIRISTAAYEKLRSMARGWETQKQTVDRALGVGTTSKRPTADSIIDVKSRRPKTRQLRKPGWRTPRHEFFLPILTAVHHLGGSAPTAQIINEVNRLMRHRLTPDDLLSVESGAVRWVNTTQWAWQSLKHAGLMAQSPKGIWTISPAGRKAAISRTLPPFKGHRAA
ncbi:MAG TPA: winged helix-turn-helix domain-containing protein [Methylomirabilota bacterium]|jgi:hypothetical protein